MEITHDVKVHIILDKSDVNLFADLFSKIEAIASTKNKDDLKMYQRSLNMKYSDYVLERLAKRFRELDLALDEIGD